APPRLVSPPGPPEIDSTRRAGLLRRPFAQSLTVSQHSFSSFGTGAAHPPGSWCALETSEALLRSLSVNRCKVRQFVQKLPRDCMPGGREGCKCRVRNQTRVRKKELCTGLPQRKPDPASAHANRGLRLLPKAGGDNFPRPVFRANSPQDK